MYDRLILPTTSESHQIGESTLDKYSFDDGTQVIEVRFDGDDRPLRILSDTEHGGLIDDAEPGIFDNPLRGRYPFTERLASYAVEMFDATGELPTNF